MTDEIERAWRDFRSASEKIKKQQGGNSAQGIEKEYAQAYQQLVKLGVAPQLRSKYR